MPPKATKKKKKTKEELEEERRLAEEAARLAEEERLRLEEEERQRLAELERQRLELLGQLQDTDAARLQAEMLDLEPFMGQLRLERSAAATERANAREWERFLSCTHVPHPRAHVAVSDRMRILQEQPDTQPAETLSACQDCYSMVDEALLYKWMSLLAEDQEEEARHTKDVAALHELVGLRIDRMSAHVLQHADLYANERGEIQLGLVQGSFQWCMWVNTSKNPRLKAVEMGALHMVVEVPKQIALANIAMRVQLRDKDEFFERCSNEFMAVGQLLLVDLLALPPPAKHVKHWVLRQVTPLASAVMRVPYPIPPAGADPATYRSEEEPPPLGFAYPCAMDLVLLDGDQVKIGWWDEPAQSWSQAGVSEVQLDRASGSLSFRTTHLGPLAIIQSRAALLPYTAWSLRPTGGRGANTAAITLATLGCPEPITFEVGAGWACLQPVTGLPMLAPLCEVRMPPEQLLLQLSSKGLHLLPQDRDAAFTGVALKERACEVAMCQDLALLAGAFLIARSRWNQAGASPQECIARVSEVVDWEAGGRTEPRHVERVFTKEREEGDKRVLAVIRRGLQGVAFCDALDKRAAYPALPGHESVESVRACSETVWGEVHASLLALLWAAVPEPEPEVPPTPALVARQGSSLTEEASEKLGLSSAPSQSDDLFAAGRSAADVADDQAQASTQPVASKPKKPGLGPPGMDPALAARLCASPAGLELVRATSPVFTETVAQMLALLRVFSFS